MKKGAIEETSQVKDVFTKRFINCSEQELLVITDKLLELTSNMEHYTTEYKECLLESKNDANFWEAMEIGFVLERFEECQKEIQEDVNRRLTERVLGEEQRNTQKHILIKCASVEKSANYSREKNKSGLEAYQARYQKNQPIAVVKLGTCAAIAGFSVLFSGLFVPEDISRDLQKQIAESVAAASIAIAFGGDARSIFQCATRKICRRFSKEQPYHIVAAKTLERLLKGEDFEKKTSYFDYIKFQPQKPIQLNKAGWSQSYYLP